MIDQSNRAGPIGAYPDLGMGYMDSQQMMQRHAYGACITCYFINLNQTKNVTLNSV